MLKVMAPPPDWSNLINGIRGIRAGTWSFNRESFVVRDDTVTAVPRALFRSILPSVELAEINAAASWSPYGLPMVSKVVLPIPDSATMVMDGVVIKPAPLMVPALR